MSTTFMLSKKEINIYIRSSEKAKCLVSIKVKSSIRELTFRCEQSLECTSLKTDSVIILSYVSWVYSIEYAERWRSFAAL